MATSPNGNLIGFKTVSCGLMTISETVRSSKEGNTR